MIGGFSDLKFCFGDIEYWASKLTIGLLMRMAGIEMESLFCLQQKSLQ